MVPIAIAMNVTAETPSDVDPDGSVTLLSGSGGGTKSVEKTVGAAVVGAKLGTDVGLSVGSLRRSWSKVSNAV